MIKPKPKNQDGKALMESMDTDPVLVFTTVRSNPLAAFLESGKLYRVFIKRSGILKGTVCLAKISEIKTDIHSAFLLLPGKEKAYIPLDELDAGVKCGMNVVVKIKKEAAKGKLITATTKLNEDEIPLREQAEHKPDFTILKPGKDYIEESLSFARDFCDKNNRTVRITTDDENVMAVIKEKNTGDQIGQPALYRDELISLASVYGLNAKLDEALGRKVWLKSGGFIVIDVTEAMTVIDVNTGKSSANKTEEEHYSDINAEACDEIVRQIMLRNLSGIILLDLINMKQEEDRQSVIRYLRKTAELRDPLLHVVDLTKLGLAECTRQKTGKMLCEQIKL